MTVRHIPAVAAILGFTALAACDDDGSGPQSPEPASLSIDEGAAYRSLSPGDSVQLQTVVLDTDGNVVEGATLEWSSSHPDRATVGDDGMVHASATYPASCSQDNPETCAAAITASTGAIEDGIAIIVLPPPATMTILPADTTLVVGDTLTVTVVQNGGRAQCYASFNPSSDNSTSLQKVGALGYRFVAVAPGTSTVGGFFTSSNCLNFSVVTATVVVEDAPVGGGVRPPE